METPQQSASVPKMDPQPGSYLCLTVKLLISICKSSSAVTCSFPSKGPNREYTSRVHCKQAGLLGTQQTGHEQAARYHDVYLGVCVTLPSCKAGWQIPLSTASEFTF